MPPPPLKLLCLWLCSEAVAAHLYWHKTKTTLSPHYKSTAAERNAQTQGWRTFGGEASEGTLSSPASWTESVNVLSPEHLLDEVHRRTNDAHFGSERPRAAPKVGTLRTKRSEAGVSRRTRHKRRRRRGANVQTVTRIGTMSNGSGGVLENLPSAMAQEQDAGPSFGLNASDFEEENQVPLFPDTTPHPPIIPRTRNKMLTNPFFPVTAESYGAYTVLILAVVIFSVGIIGNLSVMCIVCHNYYMRSISNSLLANLALWDFVVIFFCLPLVVFHALTKKWLLGEFSCRIIPYLEVGASCLAPV